LLQQLDINSQRISDELEAAMDNDSLPAIAWENATTSVFEPADEDANLTNIRDQVLKIIYIIIGTVGVVDNVFVLTVFFLFIKIADKVCGLLQLPAFSNI